MNANNVATARAIVDNLVSTLAALTGLEVTPSASVAGTGEGWAASIGPEAADKQWRLTFSAEGAAALTRLIVGGDDTPTHEAVSDALSEVCSQVAGAITLLPVAGGAKWRLGQLRQEPALAATDMAFAIQVESLNIPLAVGVAAPATQTATVVDIASVSDSRREALDRILDIELPVIVRFGRSELPLRTLARVGPGSLIDLGRSPDDPVDLLVSNRVIARGEVVVVGGNYGIRILDVINPHDRVRSLES